MFKPSIFCIVDKLNVRKEINYYNLPYTKYNIIIKCYQMRIRIMLVFYEYTRIVKSNILIILIKIYQISHN